MATYKPGELKFVSFDIEYECPHCSKVYKLEDKSDFIEKKT